MAARLQGKDGDGARKRQQQKEDDPARARRGRSLTAPGS